MALRNEPGWIGNFTREQAAGAIPNGSRVIKANSEPGDATPDGTPGIVLGSIRAPVAMGQLLFYFIEWSTQPKVAIGCLATKVHFDSDAPKLEKVLTPEAEAERADFIGEYGWDGNCSCHLSPPCNSCLHPGNPLNQAEDDSCWMEDTP